jgi:hypothetical protein
MAAKTVEKTLSANDTGLTGGHQAGILVPKDPNILGFFPKLDSSRKNPRAILDIVDDTAREWTFYFIYYNNRLFGGTRNEYRLTGMTTFLREFNLKPGDVLIFTRTSPRRISVSFLRSTPGVGNTLKLSSGWKIIETD